MSNQDQQTQNNAEPRDKKTLESDIQSTRHRLDQTLTALEDKLSPQYLINETFDYFRYGGPGEFTGNLGDSVKNNPVPFVLTAIGLSWLMLAPRSGPTHHDVSQSDAAGSGAHDSESSSGPSTLDSIKDKTGRTRDKARSATKGVGDSARSMKESMSSGSSQIRDGSRNAARNASQGARNATHQTVSFVENNPLAAAGIGIGIGLALGALFPASRFENEQLGEMRDDLVDKASESGADQADKLASKVDEKADEARADSTTDNTTPHDDTSPSSSDQTSSDDASGLADTSQDRSDRTSQAGRPDSHTGDKDMASGSRSSTAEPADHSDAPMPGARQAPDKRHY